MWTDRKVLTFDFVPPFPYASKPDLSVRFTRWDFSSFSKTSGSSLDTYARIINLGTQRKLYGYVIHWFIK